MKALYLSFSLAAFACALISARAADSSLDGNRFVAVEGAVQKPGRIQFPPDRHLSISEAISLAGGHTGNADLKRVWLFKATSTGEVSKLVVDVSLINQGKAKDIHLSPRDRIVLIGRDVAE